MPLLARYRRVPRSSPARGFTRWRNRKGKTRKALITTGQNGADLIGMADLSRGELAVWLTLYRDTKRDGAARTSLSEIARRGGMDRQTASRAVGRLARRKMLQVLRRGSLKDGPSVYRVFPFPMN